MYKFADFLHYIPHVYLPVKKSKMFQCIHISVRFSNSTNFECFSVFITFKRLCIKNYASYKVL